MTPHAAQEKLKGTLSGDKNEILYSEFGINYNNEPLQYRKGTTIIKKKVELSSENGAGGTKMRTKTFELDCDIIGDEFWNENPHLVESFKES